MNLANVRAGLISPDRTKYVLLDSFFKKMKGGMKITCEVGSIDRKTDGSFLDLVLRRTIVVDITASFSAA